MKSSSSSSETGSSATRPGIAPGLSPENHIAYQGKPGASSRAQAADHLLGPVDEG